MREIQVHKLWTKVYSQKGLTAMHHDRPHQYQKHNKNVQVFNLLFTTLSCSVCQSWALPWLAMADWVWRCCTELFHAFLLEYFSGCIARKNLKAHSTHCSRQFFIHYHGSANLWTEREGCGRGVFFWLRCENWQPMVWRSTSLRQQKLQNRNNYLPQSSCKKVFFNNFKPPQSHVHFKTYKDTISVAVHHWMALTVSSVTGFFLFFFSLLIVPGCGFDCPWEWKQIFSSKKRYWFWDSVCSSLPLTNTKSISVHHLHFQRVQI